jgi:hypothetical protein
MVKKIIEEDVDIVLGSRFLIQGGALAGGMPLYKFVANRILSNMQNFFLGLSLSEYHTGYRAYKIDFLKKVPFMRNSNDFDFDSQILIQGKVFGFKFGEVPVKTRYFKEASSVNFFVSMRYGIKTLKILFEYMLFKLKLYKPSIFI